MNVKVAFTLFLTFLVISCDGLPRKEYERVTKLRETINKYEELKTFAQNDFDIAEQGYAEAEIIIKEENKDEAQRAKELLLTAETNYNLVFEKGLPPYAELLKKQTDDSMTNAQFIKANVMYNDEYNKANAAYDKAIALYNAETKDYKVLVDSLYIAKNAYTTLYNKTKEQFDRSDEALNRVKERLAELEAMIKELESLEQATN